MSRAAMSGHSTMGTPVDPRRAKNLQALLAGSTSVVPPDVEITDLTLDSRKVSSGAAFIALPGLRTHGIGFAAQAVSAGARAILWEPAASVAAPKVPDSVALVAVPRLTEILGDLADRFFDFPSQSVRVVGITGTNGKTTAAHVLAAAAQQLGIASAYAGTLGHGRIGSIKAGTHTTPDSITVHRQIAELRDDGVRSLGMEVTSHALEQHRVDGVRFDTAVFTNLTRDHLDFHGTLEAYGAAKAKLFDWPGLKHAVINVDDAFGRKLLADHTHVDDVIVYSRSGAAADLDVRHIYARDVVAGPGGLEIEIDGSFGAATLRSRFVGDFNVENVLAVLGTLLGWNISLQYAVDALDQCVAPPGRMETLSVAGEPLAVVDYAHTPDALEKALLAVRKHCAGKLTCVFGCGGDRDRGKRPLMAAIAERLADRVIITDDNPRTEDGDEIVAEIVAGLQQPARVTVERDRAAAIVLAIENSTLGDVVLIAGKGHEDYQIVGGERRHFSDREVALAALAKRGEQS